ncbi:MAG: hypothetical protein ACFCVA_00465 [Gammaproteobacteria bacterium]
MSRIKIGLFSPPGDKQTGMLQRKLDEVAPGTCFWFTVPEAGNPPVVLDSRGVEWDGVNVSELQCGYIHGFRYANPAIPRALEDADWTLWQTDYIMDQQRASFVHSAFSELERRGVLLFNPPAAHVAAFALPDLLARLGQHGFRVPRLICTNDREAADVFCDQLSLSAWRPVTARAPWQRCTPYRRDRVMGLDRPPVLIAEIVDGPMIRAYLFDGKPLLMVKAQAPAFVPPLERLEVFTSVECPEAHRDLERLAGALQLRWATVSYVVKNSEPWIYGIDPDPMWMELPEPYRDRVVTGLAQGLMGEDVMVLGAITDAPQARDTLFLRRMLQPLFELEHCKYHPGDA